METRLVSSKGKEVVIGPGLPTVIIGERINPFGKGPVKEAMISGDMAPIRRVAAEQVEAGADVLIVSVAAFGIDEARILPMAAAAVMEEVDVPLCIESRNPAALEITLALGCGKPVVSSATAEDNVLSALLPVAKRYGTALVALASDASGIPKTAQERLEVVRRILEQAQAAGLAPEDILVDCVAESSAVNDKAVAVTLDTMHRVYDSLGLNLVLRREQRLFRAARQDDSQRRFPRPRHRLGAECSDHEPCHDEAVHDGRRPSHGARPAGKAVHDVLQKAAGRAVALGKDAVRAALGHEAVHPLPRGELFLAEDFLEGFFSVESDYAARLAAAARSLGLSLVGVDLNGGLASPFFGSNSGCLQGYFLAGYLNGPVSRLVGRCGFLDAMLSLHKTPGLFQEICEAAVREAEETARLAADRGISAITLADDIAGTQGLFFSPVWFAEMLLPVYARIVRTIKESGLAAFFHSDGDTRKIIGPLIEAGYTCVHPVDAQAGLDLHSLRAEFGTRVCFMGHIDIVGWDAERVAAEVEGAESGFSHGGLILGSSGGVSMDTVSRLASLYPGWRQGRPI